MKFADILYGSIELPEWLIPFIKIPEFVRLRGVRLSNVDSYEFKDFSSATRWEHCIGAAHLAIRLSKRKKLSKSDTIHLVLAALLHDIATPPFAHTIEYILEGYDHELESNRILNASDSDNSNPSFPIFASQIPQFRNICKKISKEIGLKINPDFVAELVTGNGDLGYLINGSIDLDNIDNVTRACLFLGIPINRNIPYELVDWLSTYNSTPTELDKVENQYVKEWLNNKNLMYSKFYSSSDEELGRQAFLQHLIRRSYKQGLSRRSIIWNTDDGLLSSIERFTEKYQELEKNSIFSKSLSLQELVERYKLLEGTFKIIEIPIEDNETFKIIKNPSFASWLEEELSTPTFEPFVIVNSKRFNTQNTLFNNEGGLIQIFKLSNPDIKLNQLPISIQEDINPKPKKIEPKMLNLTVRKKIMTALSNKPWLSLTDKRKDSIKANLDSVGNWSFRLSRNEGLHSYPATFVHAIPATLINTLGLKGELVVDTFGGTGQTAMEGVKLGCKVISADNNLIATMITKAKLNYLSKPQRHFILSINEEKIKSLSHEYMPNIPDIHKWHNKKTLLELSKIHSLLNEQENKKIKNFLSVCFSDILTTCTARKGLEHGYFADNTPLSKSDKSPPYENAINHFIYKIKRNIEIIERFYSHFERNGQSVEKELSNAKIIHLDTTKSSSEDFGIKPNTASGIITSPPYLCMADYTLGQRLSYYWLFPEQMNIDFRNEIGSRRSRTQNGTAINKYYEGIRGFAKQSAELLRKNGFLATVIGAPVANAYKDKEILIKIDQILYEEGFDLFWETNRPINWHRNHGYARLKEERVAVHVRR